MSATLRDLIEGCGGGMAEGRELKAIIPGGVSAPVLGPAGLDVGLAIEALAAAGSMAGSGAVIVMDDRTCMVQIALRTRRVLPPRELREVHAVPRGRALGRRHAAARGGGDRAP